MTISDRAYVWTWLPGEDEPVVAGVVQAEGAAHSFAYGQSYLQRSDAFNLFGPEVELRRGRQLPEAHLSLHGFIRDGLPDGWGQKVIDLELGRQNLTSIEYMLLSGSDRFGAIDFQQRSDEYIARTNSATLEELATAAERIEQGEELNPALRVALMRGTSIGGARPKATIADGGDEFIAKFSSNTDSMPMIKAEATSMRLATAVGISAADVKMTESLGKQVLLVKRFDRAGAGRRLHAASVLTLMKERAEDGHFLTYPAIVARLKEFSSAPAAVGPDMFARIAFNIAVGNTDDHARNHSVFWDGQCADLTPAYDLAPQPHSGMTASHAMGFGKNFGSVRASNFFALLGHCHLYDLERTVAAETIDRIISTVVADFEDAADFAHLTRAERKRLFGGVSGQFLNDGSLTDWPKATPTRG